MADKPTKKRARKSRSDWIGAAVHAMAEGGVAAVRVERLAKALGVTKGSFYWHFESQQALVDAVLQAWEEQGTEAIIDAVMAGEASPTERLLHLWNRTLAGSHRLQAELAIRDLARHDPQVAALVKRVDARRLGSVRQLMTELGWPEPVVEARSLLCYSLLLGNFLIQADHGERTRAEVLELAIEQLLTPPVDQTSSR